MAFSTVVVQPAFICLVNVASLALAFAASEDHSSDAGDCQVAPAVAATAASMLQSRKHVLLEQPLGVGAGHGVQKALFIVNEQPPAVKAGHGGVQKSIVNERPPAFGRRHEAFEAPLDPAARRWSRPYVGVRKAAPIVNERPRGGHVGFQKRLPMDSSLVKLVESSDATGRTVPEAIPSGALPNLALLQASSGGTGMQNFEAAHRQSPESSSLKKQPSGSAQSALSAAQLIGLVGTLAHAVMPISLMLIVSAAILAMLHRCAATQSLSIYWPSARLSLTIERKGDAAQQNAEGTINRTLQLIGAVQQKQSEGQGSAAQSTSPSLSFSSRPSLATAEPASRENVCNKATKGADEAAGSPAVGSAHVVTREEGESLCEGLGQSVPRVS